MRRLKKLIPKPIKMLIGHYTSKCTELVKTSYLYMIISSLFCRKKDWYGTRKRKIILVNTPTHPNLGDQAIALAEIAFIKEYFVDDLLVELHDDIFFSEIWNAKKYISAEDVILCHGGGNMGTDYYWCEKVRQTVIKLFPNNKVIVFPQTIYYADNKKSMRALQKSADIYNQHKHVMICAREKKSYDVLMQNYFNCKVVLVPDIVLFLKPNIQASRKDALLCFRADREKAISGNDETTLINMVRERGYNANVSDTVLGGIISPEDRETVLLGKLREFASSEIVITDRLHGMIFSYITNTPCIVLPNYNHKVKGFYAWFAENDSRTIKFIRDASGFDNALDAIEPLDENDRSWAITCFEKIVDFANDRRIQG